MDSSNAIALAVGFVLPASDSNLLTLNTMSPLTEEEKNKIVEEERLRAEERTKHSQQPAQSGIPVCQLCGSPMKKKAEQKTGLALLLIIFGIVCCLFVIGAVVGIPLIIIGLYYGSKNKGLWVCTKCGYKVERKLDRSDSFKLR